MNKHLDYQEEDGIHKFTWKSTSRRSIDTWLQWMTHIMIRDGTMGYMLFDFSEIGLPPVRYASMQIRRWLIQHPPSERGSVVAIIYPPSNIPFLIVARSYTATHTRGRPVKLRFFSSETGDAACEWLHEQMSDNALQS